MADRPALEENEAIDRLAQRLYWKMEHLDPSEEPDWEKLNDWDKDNYRLCVEAVVLDERDLVLCALGLAHHDLIHRRPQLREQT